MQQYDVVVIGLGAMGSATLYQLSRQKGLKVLGIDQYRPPHSHGSSHGDTRITRQAIGEGRDYAQLVIRANQIWRDLEKQSGEELLVQNGALVMGAGDDTFINETIESAKKYAIKHEILKNSELKRRFPQFKLTTEFGYLEPTGGYLAPEKCVQVQLKLAEQQGAEILLDTKVNRLEKTSAGTKINLDGHGDVLAKKVVVCAGPWVTDFLSVLLKANFRVQRQVQYWFEIKQNYTDYLPANFPSFFWEFARETVAGVWGVYGFPALAGKDGGLKVSSEQFEHSSNPNDADQVMSPQESEFTYENFIGPYFRDLGPKQVKTDPCVYTDTPDHNFVIDWVPSNRDVLLCSPCSGHGFKHSAAIGEVVARMVLGQRPEIDVGRFGLARFM